jgi:hypothetical protein
MPPATRAKENLAKLVKKKQQHVALKRIPTPSPTGTLKPLQILSS